MNFIEFSKNRENYPCFSLQEIQLFDTKFLRWNLKNRYQKDYLDHLCKWRYTLKETEKSEEMLYTISNKIYQPSYISMESALRYYDIIPEWVFITTACSTKKTQTLEGDRGTFYYYHLKPELFWGYTIQKKRNLTFYLATIEKTVCDFFYLKKQLTKTDFSDLRFDVDHLRKLTTKEKLLECAKKFWNQRVLHLVSDFISFF